MANILVTCVGSGVGQSAIDSLNLLRLHKVIGCDTNRNVYANNFCDDFHIVPSIYSNEYLGYILNLCIKKNIDIIIPGHDHELLLLSENLKMFEEKGIKVIVSKPNLIKISRDKFEWYEYFKSYGCEIVPTFQVKDFKKKPDPAIFPAIIKPSGGSASQGITILNTLDGLSITDDEDIIQPYLFPKKDDPNYETINNFVKKGKFIQLSEISIQLIFTSKSEFAGIFISKNSLKNGVPTFVDPINPDEFEYIDEIMKFVPICLEKKVVGPVNIQGRITENGLKFFEMNMRFTGITGNRAQLGFNEVEFLVNDFLGQPSKLNEYAKNKLGVRQVACTTIPRLSNEKTKKTFTVLGAGGFIGSYFTHELIKTNNYQKINIVCRSESYQKYKAMYNQKKVTVIPDTDQFLESIYCQTDVLINFVSALAFKPDSEKFASILFQYKQVQKIIKANIPLVINTSSQSVYNQTINQEKTEKSEILVTDSYAFQKYIAEQFFESIESFSPSSKTVSLRFSRVVGTHFSNAKPSGFFAKVIESQINGRKIAIPNPENNTNIIDIRDVIHSILFIIEAKDKTSIPNILNIGGTNISIKDYCEKVINCLGTQSKRSLIEYGDSSDITSSSMIDSLVFKKFNWEPKYSIEDTINELANSIINN